MEPPLCVVSSWLKKRVYTILISITISGSSNLDNCFYHINITSQKFYSTPFHLLFIILYSSPQCDSTLDLPDYLLLRHSCTWDKTSIFWSCYLTLHVYWTTNQKERRMHDFGFVEERGVPFSLSFYIIRNPNPFSTK